LLAWLARLAGSRGVVLYSLESQEYQRLTDFGTNPVWLSDNCRLIFRNEGKLFLLDSESGEYREVLSIAGAILLGPKALSQDNLTIYFTHAAREADIWMLTLNEERK
jgi:hypothetical protein